MGYQESFLVYRLKDDFVELCENLNYSELELNERGVTVYAIGKIKKKIILSCSDDPDEDYGFIPEDLYFVWWGGERHPFQSGRNISDEDREIFDPDMPFLEIFFCDYINMDEILSDIDLKNKNGILQENNCVRIITIENYIADRFIQQLN